MQLSPLDWAGVRLALKFSTAIGCAPAALIALFSEDVGWRVAGVIALGILFWAGLYATMVITHHFEAVIEDHDSQDIVAAKVKQAGWKPLIAFGLCLWALFELTGSLTAHTHIFAAGAAAFGDVAAQFSDE